MSNKIDINDILNSEEEIQSGNKNKKYRGYFLTIQESSFDKQICYENLGEYVQQNFKNFEYACWSLEKGDTTGNVHMHLYIELKNPLAFNSIKKKFPKANIKERIGTPMQVRTYVEKPEGHKFSDGKDKSETTIKPMREIGDFSKLSNQKKRGSAEEKRKANDIIKELIEKYDNYIDCLKDNPSFCHLYGKEIKDLLMEKQLEAFKNKYCEILKADNGEDVIKVKRMVYFIYGNSGAGKTTGVKLKYGDKEVSQINIPEQIKGEIRFDDFKVGSGVMLLDEFYGQIPIQQLLTLLDSSGIGTLYSRYENKINTAHTIIMTSNNPFCELYENEKSENEERYKALKRRINGGVWRMYQSNSGERYIACETQIEEIEERLRHFYKLDEPPVSLRNVKLITNKELLEIIEKDEEENCKFSCPF